MPVAPKAVTRTKAMNALGILIFFTIVSSHAQILTSGLLPDDVAAFNHI
jgi:hypothetical protein